MTNPQSGASVELGQSRATSPVPRGEEVERRAVPLYELLKKLTPADQRLLRELAYKLALLHGLDGRAVPSEFPEEPIELTEYMDAWGSSLLVQGRSPRTVRLYRICVQMLLRSCPSPTHDDIELFLATRVTAVGPGTLANSIFAIKSFLSYLTLKGIIAVNLAQYINAPPRPQRERVIPSANRVARLLNAPTITNRDRALILVFAACGLRASELVGARRDDVDLARLKITVVGKGNKQRSVPMTEQTATALENHLRSLPPSPWLFPGKDPTRPVTQSAINERFTTLSERAGVPRITPHQLRHYFASIQLNAGISLKIVSQWLGHASPDITARIYWHILDESERVKAYEQHDPLQQINEEMARMITGQLSFDFKEMGK